MNASGNQPVRVVRSPEDLAVVVCQAKQAGQRIGLVPTMGALHAGHLSLAEASCQECDVTIVTIFVNPTQFGPDEDLTRYPRDLAHDFKLLEPLGVDIVFAPSVETMYPAGHETRVELGELGSVLEGACRPGHFSGVATVVLKLFHLVPADVAYFGHKDYQQTLVVRQMVRDLNVPIEIRVCPIVRAADGLALSSRNTYLSPDEHRQALGLSQSLQLAADLVAAGETDAARLEQQMRAHLAKVGGIVLEYIALLKSGTVTPVDRIEQETVVAIAARVGQTRLIDNRIIQPAPAP